MLITYFVDFGEISTASKNSSLSLSEDIVKLN